MGNGVVGSVRCDAATPQLQCPPLSPPPLASMLRMGLVGDRRWVTGDGMLMCLWVQPQMCLQYQMECQHTQIRGMEGMHYRRVHGDELSAIHVVAVGLCNMES